MFGVFWGVDAAFEVTAGVGSGERGRVAELDAEEEAEAACVL